LWRAGVAEIVVKLSSTHFRGAGKNALDYVPTFGRAADYFVVKQSETANPSDYACSIRRL
jgi:hypothetical protein